jgi:sarcosine oxidase
VAYDAIVIGVGGMGSSTLYHLSKRGLRVLGLEQFNLGHDLGSSHGVTRIIRLAYAEGEAYVPLLRRAYELWRELEYVANERLLFITGGIDAGPRDGKLVQGSHASCKLHNLPHEVLTSEELHRRFPAFCFPKTLIAVHQPDAGFVLSERSIVAHVTAAQALGAEIHARERVRKWEVVRGHVVVHTNVDTYRAKRLVITAGPWASKLIEQLRRKKLAEAERQVLIWTEPRRPELFRLGALPVFYMEAMEQGQRARYYGLPIVGSPGFKFGKYHHLNQRVDPGRMDRECGPEDEAVLRAGIRKYFPDADGPTLAMKTCMFSNSPDEHFVIDLHPSCPQVSIAAGFSGHGFKFASVVGEIMADLALEGRSSRFEDLNLFSINRPRTHSR